MRVGNLQYLEIPFAGLTGRSYNSVASKSSAKLKGRQSAWNEFMDFAVNFPSLISFNILAKAGLVSRATLMYDEVYIPGSF